MTQISLFDGDTPLKITKPIRLIELFAGYGSQSLALKYLKVPFEHWKICEWAVKSIQAYKDLHFGDDTCDYSKAYSVDELIEMLLAKGISADYNAPMTREQIKRMGEQKIRTVYNNIIATNNLVSVCNAHAQDFEIQDTEKYTYILTYSFPCQDLSKAGNGAGMAKGSGTRSGMLWEVERILDECNGNLPQILLMENVPDVIGANNVKHFAQWVKKLEQLGYTSKWQCLNAKDYGVPQNRDRCFMVSWLGNHYYDFPTPIKLEKRLKDVLETNVDEKYYLSSDIIKYFEKHTQESIEKGNGFRFAPSDGDVIGKAITTRAGGRMDDNFIKCECVGMLGGEKYEKMHDIARRVYDTNGIAPTQHTCGGGNLETKIVEPLALDEQNGYIRQDGTVGTLTTDGSSPKHNNRIVELNGKHPYELSDAMKKYIVSKDDKYRVSNGNLIVNRDIACSKTTREGCTRADTSDYISPDLMPNENIANKNTLNYRIRKLTPKECGRLMGVRDDDIDTMSVNQSNSSLFHCFGDSIVVDVLMAIFKQMI